jgi:hypothetical protein
MGHKGPVLRPKWVGSEGARTPLLFYSILNLSRNYKIATWIKQRIYVITMFLCGYVVVQLVEATSQKVAGSIPGGVIGIFHWHKPSGRTIALGTPLLLTDISTVNISWALRWPVHRADNLTTCICWLSWKLETSTSWNSQVLFRSAQELLFLYPCSYFLWRWWVKLRAVREKAWPKFSLRCLGYKMVQHDDIDWSGNLGFLQRCWCSSAGKWLPTFRSILRPSCSG